MSGREERKDRGKLKRKASTIETRFSERRRSWIVYGIEVTIFQNQLSEGMHHWSEHMDETVCVCTVCTFIADICSRMCPRASPVNTRGKPEENKYMQRTARNAWKNLRTNLDWVRKIIDLIKLVSTKFAGKVRESVRDSSCVHPKLTQRTSEWASEWVSECQRAEGRNST